MNLLEIIPQVPIGDWVEASVSWIKFSFDSVLDLLSAFSALLVEWLTEALLFLPSLILIPLFALLGWVIRSWRLGLGVLVSFLLIESMGQWENAMDTLALVLIATIVAIIISVPLGIAAAKNDKVSMALKPILDLMQTMPAFVYLIPAIIFLGLGAAPGMFATTIFALPPGVRLTELGIRQVDSETVEAGRAFGATEWEILRGIQIPLAVPNIMAGINQVIMLSLSMAVIAGLVGAEGLGKEVVSAMSQVDTAKGTEAGLSIVFLAIFLDRLTAALGAPSEHKTSLLASWRKRAEKRRKNITA